MTAFIDMNKCSAQLTICNPVKECPNQAIKYLEDDNAILGVKMEIDDTKCKGCGTCIPLCCGNAIYLI